MNLIESKKITFVLPGMSYKPSGGSKIIFQYANCLVARGYKIKIIFTCHNSFINHHIPEVIRRMICRIFVALFPSCKELNKKVTKKAVFDMKDDKVPTADYIVATAYETAWPVYNLDSSKGKKIYFIQDYENWTCSNEEVEATYNLMQNVVISKWLKKIDDSHTDS